MTESATTEIPTLAPRSTDARVLRLPTRVSFVAMSAALLAFFVAAGAPTPLLPLYEKRWGFAPSMLTLAFGVYSLALIAALVVVGSLSDHIGRRPMLITGLALELVAMLVFLGSSSIGWLIAGRILQGVATGIASSTFGAAVVELASERRKKLGALMTSLASTAGLAVGALFAGLVAIAIPSAAAPTVWLVLVVVMAAGTVLAALTPETSTRRPGALLSLIPRVTVPAQVRRLFVATVPSVIAAFLDTALFLGLLPTILGSVFGITAPIVGGLVTFVMFTAAAVTSATTGAVGAHRLRMLGSAGLAIGAVILIAAIGTAAITLIWIGAVVAGAGMGAAFSGSIRGLIPEARPHERAGLFAALFVVAYLTLGISAIVAGVIATAIGVLPMAIGFGVVFAIVAIVAVVASRRPAKA